MIRVELTLQGRIVANQEERRRSIPLLPPSPHRRPLVPTLRGLRLLERGPLTPCHSSVQASLVGVQDRGRRLRSAQVIYNHLLNLAEAIDQRRSHEGNAETDVLVFGVHTSNEMLEQLGDESRGHAIAIIFLLGYLSGLSFCKHSPFSVVYAT